MAGQSGTARRKPGARQGYKPNLAFYGIFSFGCGMGLFCLLMALFAILMAKAPIPPQAARPLASLAATAGATVSSYILAGKLGSKYLLCGIGCSAFYLFCLTVAGVLYTGKLGSATVATVSIPAVMLLFGGLLGGAAASLRGSG